MSEPLIAMHGRIDAFAMILQHTGMIELYHAVIGIRNSRTSTSSCRVLLEARARELVAHNASHEQ